MKLVLGDCLEQLRLIPENSIDALVTDPPYGFGFMGKKWDYDLPSIDIWRECLRVLKPGAHILSFGGPRTYHRMACGIEDAGFEIRDQLQWLFGSGFPKSLDVSKAIDKSEGHWRGRAGAVKIESQPSKGKEYERNEKGEPITATATAWQGWGTALKPANEPILLARKPLGEKTVAANVLKWGTGGINVDGCRIEYNGPVKHVTRQDTVEKINPNGWRETKRTANRPATATASGRFPANLILDEEAARMLDEQSGACKSRGEYKNFKPTAKGIFQGGAPHEPNKYANQTGGASRFFYCAKASRRERNAGLEGMLSRPCGMMEDDNYPIKTGSGNLRNTHRQNHHPTVKPLTLMRYLCRLITPPAGIVLDPFMGSGTTGVAALHEGFDFVGIEREKEYFEIAERRISNTQIEGVNEYEDQPDLWDCNTDQSV